MNIHFLDCRYILFVQDKCLHRPSSFLNSMGAFESLECSKASSCDCAQHDDVFPSLMMERPKSQPSYLDWRSAAIIDLSKPQLQKNTSSDMEAVMHEAEQVRLRVEDLLSSDSVARLPKRLSFGGSTSSWPGNGVGEGRSLARLGLYSTSAAVLVVIKVKSCIHKFPSRDERPTLILRLPRKPLIATLNLVPFFLLRFWRPMSSPKRQYQSSWKWILGFVKGDFWSFLPWYITIKSSCAVGICPW